MSLPTEMNDPFDSLLYFNIDAIKQHVEVEFSEKTLAAIQEGKIPTSTSKIWGESILDEIHSSGLISKIRSVPEDEKSLFLKRQIALSNKIAEHVKSHVEDSCKTRRIACFSEKVDSILMWGHYASNHTGFALEYDFAQNNKICERGCDDCINLALDFPIFPVNYCAERYDATSYAEYLFISQFVKVFGVESPMGFPDRLIFIKAYLNKSLDWSYEKEWRIIQKNEELEKVIELHKCNRTKLSPKALYLGCKIDEYCKNELCDIANSKGIPVYQMELQHDDTKYQLSCKRVI